MKAVYFHRKKVEMKTSHLYLVPCLAAFVIGVILFALFWKIFFGSASEMVVLMGMAGVALTVTIFWIRYEMRLHKK